jgi:hypothetical protein
MGDLLRNQWQIKIAIAIFAFFTIWWLIIQSTSISTENIQLQIFAALYGIMALWGGFCGIFISRKWGFFKSLFGRAILMFSIGLMLQEFGQVMYSFYIYFLKVDVPYPSLGDIGYFGSIPFYIYGAYLLGKASGVKFGLKSFENKIFAILMPVGMLSLGYIVFLQGYEFDFSSPLTFFLDFAYPFGQAIYVSIALLIYLLSRNLLGGLMRGKVMFIVLALVTQFMADFIFLLQASKGTWYAGGINDYMYLLSYFFMTIAILQIGSVYQSLKNSQ